MSRAAGILLIALLARPIALPAQKFHIGRPATQEEIARVHLDIGPDGHNLPAGRGNAASGEAVYAKKCAVCHGVAGEGVRNLGPALISRPGEPFDFAISMEREGQKTIGNYWPYATTLFDYVRRAMPFTQPGSLRDDEVYAVAAYLLWKNGIIKRADVMNAETLPLVRMPAHDRFVRDDRETSQRVK